MCPVQLPFAAALPPNQFSCRKLYPLPMTPLFTKKLLDWNTGENTRSMPWKGEKDPYKIWLSEIILQQTRVEQGWKYYEKFITDFPTVQQLAESSDEKIFKAWEGLGYYTRCKN